MADKGTVGDRPSPNFHVICHSIRIGGHFSVWFIYIYIYIYIYIFSEDNIRFLCSCMLSS